MTKALAFTRPEPVEPVASMRKRVRALDRLLVRARGAGQHSAAWLVEVERNALATRLADSTGEAPKVTRGGPA